MYGYPIHIHRDGHLLVGSLPDWPECNPIGDTIEEVLDDAVGSIEEMAMARIEDREPIPAPVEGAPEPAVRLPLLTLLKFGLHIALRERHWRKADLARAMGATQKTVDRLLDLNHASRLDQLDRAFRALEYFPTVRLPGAGGRRRE